MAVGVGGVATGDGVLRGLGAGVVPSPGVAELVVAPGFGTSVTPGVGLPGMLGRGVGATMLHEGFLQQGSLGS